MLGPANAFFALFAALFSLYLICTSANAIEMSADAKLTALVAPPVSDDSPVSLAYLKQDNNCGITDDPVNKLTSFTAYSGTARVTIDTTPFTAPVTAIVSRFGFNDVEVTLQPGGLEVVPVEPTCTLIGVKLCSSTLEMCGGSSLFSVKKMGHVFGASYRGISGQSFASTASWTIEIYANVLPCSESVNYHHILGVRGNLDASDLYGAILRRDCTGVNAGTMVGLYYASEISVNTTSDLGHYVLSRDHASGNISFYYDGELVETKVSTKATTPSPSAQVTYGTHFSFDQSMSSWTSTGSTLYYARVFGGSIEGADVARLSKLAGADLAVQGTPDGLTLQFEEYHPTYAAVAGGRTYLSC